MTVVNAFIIFKERVSAEGNPINVKEFRLSVGIGIAGTDRGKPQKT